MKKIYMLAAALLVGGVVSAQTILNPGFEGAIATTAFPGFTSVDDWTCLGQGTAETAAPDQELQSIHIQGIADPTLAGFLGLASDTVAGMLIQTIDGPVTNPDQLVLSFHYMWTSMYGEVGTVAIQITDTMATGATDDVLMYDGSFDLTSDVTTWTAAAIDLTQITGTGTPNQISIVAATNKDFTTAITTTTPGTGSILSLDAFMIGWVGLDEKNTVKVSAFPNPANNVLNITSSEEVASVKVVTMDGKVVATSTSASVNVEALTAGVYVYEVTTVAGNVVRNNFMKN